MQTIASPNWKTTLGVRGVAFRDSTMEERASQNSGALPRVLCYSVEYFLVCAREEITRGWGKNHQEELEDHIGRNQRE